MLIVWFRDNLPIKADFEWAKTAGGMWGSGHPPADRMNAGEKLMYWQFAVFGIALAASGFVLDFPNIGQTRAVMQWAHVIHVVFAIGMIVTVMGHMYMGLIGVEGVLEGMIKGRVDIHWAEQHHNLWYYQQLKQGVKPESTPEHRQATPLGRAGT
jgi:formate dehydrogenase subunit gamma